MDDGFLTSKYELAEDCDQSHETYVTKKPGRMTGLSDLFDVSINESEPYELQDLLQ